MRRIIYMSVFFAAAVGVCAPASAQMLTGFGDDMIASPVINAAPTQITAYQPIMTQAQQDLNNITPVSVAPPQRLTGFDQAVAVPITQSSQADPNTAPVDLTADSLTHDDQKGIVTASGDVMLVQADRILRADEIIYDLNKDEATARGNVVLNEPTGDIYLSDSVTLQNQMKNGFITGFQGQLSDGSRLWAERAERENASKVTLHKARYTACEEVCGDRDAPPPWQIKSREVTHDKALQTIAYKDATFEVFGTPIGYLPYFSHPDGTIGQKSGFLSPSIGFDSDFGAFVENEYYWGIGPDKDATIGLTVMTDENPLLTGEFRQQFDDAALRINGSVTSSDRTDISNGLTSKIDDELRGHLFGKALWDINQKWRAGVDVQYSSDDQYLRQYDISSEDVLESQVYAERFSGRNYAVGRLLKFQDVRIRENQEDQPAVLPEIIADFVGEPGALPVIGGNWRAQGSFLGLHRDGSDQDLNRAIAQLGWQRRLVSDYGFVDRIEDQSRVTYGLRTGLYGYEGSYVNVFAGQSRRFDDDDNPFPAGSGLDQKDSDYVGEIAGQYKDNLSLNYRFQLDNETISPATGDGGTEILFRIGLKNMGEFQESTYEGSEKWRSINACNLVTQ